MNWIITRPPFPSVGWRHHFLGEGFLETAFITWSSRIWVGRRKNHRASDNDILTFGQPVWEVMDLVYFRITRSIQQAPKYRYRALLLLILPGVGYPIREKVLVLLVCDEKTEEWVDRVEEMRESLLGPRVDQIGDKCLEDGPLLPSYWLDRGCLLWQATSSALQVFTEALFPSLQCIYFIYKVFPLAHPSCV